MSEMIKIKDWDFAPDTGVLQRGDETSRLEVRTAALLAYLARHQGDLVSISDIIEQVWDGRTVSPNSVAVVISDIRRALGDDPRQPQYIETLPKRGYVLMAEPDQPDARPPASLPGLEAAGRDRRWPMAGVIGAIIAAMAVIFVLRGSPQPYAMDVYIMPADNQTGDTQYDPLTVSVTELLAVELARHDIFRVTTDPGNSVVVSGKLILWDGHPAMSVHAKNAADGHVIWSSMASGPETLLPQQVRQEISELAVFAQDQAPGDAAR